MSASNKPFVQSLRISLEYAHLFRYLPQLYRPTFFSKMRFLFPKRSANAFFFKFLVKNCIFDNALEIGKCQAAHQPAPCAALQCGSLIHRDLAHFTNNILSVFLQVPLIQNEHSLNVLNATLLNNCKSAARIDVALAAIIMLQEK